jgi:hypothetical protein
VSNSSDNLDTSGERGRAGYTPGPWRQAHVVSAYQTKRRVIIAAEESEYAGSPVCEVYGAEDDDCVANARLIAAAPELLEALQQCLQHIELDESMHGRPFGAGNVAREAIKKATGE